MRRNDGAGQYELIEDGQVIGRAEYQERSGMVAITHTEIDPAREGQGLGAQLARAALDDVRAQGKALLPACPFIAASLRRWPGDQDLVPEARRGEFGL